MKKILFAFAIILSLASCDKQSEEEPQVLVPEKEEVKGFKDKIVLSEITAKTDTIGLSWTQLDTSEFKSYILSKKEVSTGQFFTFKQISNKEITAAIDVPASSSEEVQYQVTGVLRSGKTIPSNVVSYSRGSNLKLFQINPFDVIFSKSDNKLYFFEKSGIISIYDIATETIIKQINTNAKIGFSDFGVYNGKRELYVPRNDGWVFVYDALTLEKITQISVGKESSCVVFSNNNLFISTAAWTNRPLKVLSRATGQLISETGDFELTRFKKAPGSNTDLIEITINIGPTDQDSYRFTNSGTLISHTNDLYHGDYPLDANIFEFFPDGQKYISSSSGSIYSANLTYQGSLPRGNLNFSSFDFDSENKRIYAGCQTKNIEVYALNNYERIKSITTQRYPYKVFVTNNKIICVERLTASTGYYYEAPSGSIGIEILDK